MAEFMYQYLRSDDSFDYFCANRPEIAYLERLAGALGRCTHTGRECGDVSQGEWGCPRSAEVLLALRNAGGVTQSDIDAAVSEAVTTQTPSERERMLDLAVADALEHTNEQDRSPEVVRQAVREAERRVAVQEAPAVLRPFAQAGAAVSGGVETIMGAFISPASAPPANYTAKSTGRMTPTGKQPGTTVFTTKQGEAYSVPAAPDPGQPAVQQA